MHLVAWIIQRQWRHVHTLTCVRFSSNRVSVVLCLENGEAYAITKPGRPIDFRRCTWCLMVVERWCGKKGGSAYLFSIEHHRYLCVGLCRVCLYVLLPHACCCFMLIHTFPSGKCARAHGASATCLLACANHLSWLQCCVAHTHTRCGFSGVNCNRSSGSSDSRSKNCAHNKYLISYYKS